MSHDGGLTTLTGTEVQRKHLQHVVFGTKVKICTSFTAETSESFTQSQDVSSGISGFNILVFCASYCPLKDGTYLMFVRRNAVLNLNAFH